MGLDFILILVGVILLFVAAFGVGYRSIRFLPLGLALIALTLLTGCDSSPIYDEDVATNADSDNAAKDAAAPDCQPREDEAPCR